MKVPMFIMLKAVRRLFIQRILCMLRLWRFLSKKEQGAAIRQFRTGLATSTIWLQNGRLWRKRELWNGWMEIWVAKLR